VANTTSAQKAMRQAQRRAARNQAARSAVRTYFKKASVAVTGTGQDAAADVVLEAVRALDKAAQRGIIHRNAAARRKSRLMSRLHQLSLTDTDAAGTSTKAAEAKPGRTQTKRATPAKAASADKKPASRTTTAKRASSKKN